MTRSRLNRIVTLAGAGMILCWFDVLNSLLMPAFSRPPLPVSLAALILALSAGSAALIKSWTLRPGGVILFYAVGIFVSITVVLLGSGDPAFSLWNFTWMIDGPSATWIVWQWVIFIVNVIWAVLLYCLGRDLYHQKIRLLPVSMRLDIGITALFVALIAKLIAEHKGVVIPYEHTMGRQLACFMMLGLFSIGVVRNRASHRNSTISYYKGAGMVLSFGMLAAVFGAAMIMLFLPDMIRGALWGKQVLDRSWPYIEHSATLFVNSDFAATWIKAFAFTFDKAYLPSIVERLAPGHQDPFYTRLVIAAGILYGLVVLWFVIEWLLMKPEPGKRKFGPWVVLRIMARRLKRMILRIIHMISFKRDPLYRVEDFYRRLQVWGSHSGMPRAAQETPNEYGARLAHSFPGLTPEISFLVAMFNIARFRGTPPPTEQFQRVRQDWQRLCSPQLWPLRARLWLFKARI